MANVSFSVEIKNLVPGTNTWYAVWRYSSSQVYQGPKLPTSTKKYSFPIVPNYGQLTVFSCNWAGIAISQTVSSWFTAQNGATYLADLTAKTITVPIPEPPPPIPTPAPGLATLQQRIDAAKGFIDRLYQSDDTYGYIKEHPGFPLGIRVRNTTDMRYAGDWRVLGPIWLADLDKMLTAMAVSKISNVTIRPAYDIWTLNFEDSTYHPIPDYNDPVIQVRRNYFTWGETSYYATFLRYFGTYHSDLWCGDLRLWSDLSASSPKPMAWPYPFRNTDGYFFPASRYTVRHGAALGQHIYTIWGDWAKANKLSKLRSDYGFDKMDIYDPLFNRGAWLSDNFMFSHDCYPDTVSKWSKLPRGQYPHKYPYFSKIQLALDDYINYSWNDTLLQCLQALHILNKYSDPYHSYLSTTPYDVALHCWNSWNGFGIKHPLGSSSEASAARSAVFLALASVLGWKYNIAYMRERAAYAAWFLTAEQSPQAGVYPLNPYYCRTKENGEIIRPPYQGSFYSQWARVSTSSGYRAASVSSQSTLEKVIDWFGMKPEDCGPIPGGQESTALMLQALRIFLYYSQGIAHPFGSRINLP